MLLVLALACTTAPEPAETPRCGEEACWRVEATPTDKVACCAGVHGNGPVTTELHALCLARAHGLYVEPTSRCWAERKTDVQPTGWAVWSTGGCIDGRSAGSYFRLDDAGAPLESSGWDSQVCD